MIYFKITDSHDRVVAQNFTGSEISKAGSRIQEYKKEGISFSFSSSEQYFRNSISLFKRCGSALEDIFCSVYGYFTDQLDASAHSLSNIQIKAKQKIETIIDLSLIRGSNDYADLQKKVTEMIISDPETAAEVMIYLEKRIFEIGAHIKGFDLIHQDKKLQLDPRPQSMKAVAFNVARTFFDDFSDVGVKAVFDQIDHDFAERYRINIDYSVMNVAFYNIYLNATKYCLPGSAIYHQFDVYEPNGTFEFRFIMQSLRIEKDELQKVFEFGTRGKHAGNIEGRGIGLFVVQKALELNQMDIWIKPDFGDSKNYHGKQYIRNLFIISGKLAYSLD